MHPPPDPEQLPHPITFFTSSRERSAIIKALRRLAPDRRTALCRSLGIRTDDDRTGGAPSRITAGCKNTANRDRAD